MQRKNDITHKPAPALSSLVADLAATVDRLTQQEISRGLPDAAAAGIARRVVLDRLTRQADMTDARGLVDLSAEIEALTRGQRSQYTARAYRRAWVALSDWCANTGRNPASINPADADAYVLELRGMGYAPASVRLQAHALSAIYKFISRRHPAISNPWAGCPVLPAAEITRAIIPTKKEIRHIIAAARERGDEDLAAAVDVMATTGIRIGGLPELHMTPASWYTVTKGQRQDGTEPLPARLRAILEARGRQPFAGITRGALQMRLQRLTGYLADAGTIAARYSAHDFRHYFAGRLYAETRDIFRVSRALNHADIGITGRYLLNTHGIDVSRGR